MKTVLRFFAVVAAICGLTGGTNAFAQKAEPKVKVNVEKAITGSLQSPEFSGPGASDKKFKPRTWLDIDVPFRVETDSKDEKYIDGLVFKFFVAVKNERGKGFFLISKEIEYVNVPVNKDMFASAYMSPASIERLTGSDKVNRGSVDVVGVEVTYNGQMVGASTTKFKEGWWAKPSENLVPADNKFPLLNKDETPFKALWYDRYPDIRIQR